MAPRLEELAKTIDHTLLDPAATAADVERLCAEAREFHFASVCVLPSLVRPVAELLRGHDVKVGALIGLPVGAQPRLAKIAATEASLAAGADELDVTMNAVAMHAGDFRLVRDELAAVVRAVRMRSVSSGRGRAIVKVIVDVARLDEKLKRLACKIVEAVGADFAGASIGERKNGVDEVELLRDCLPESVGVKAVGAFAAAEEAWEIVNAGAARIGTTAAVGIMRGTPRTAAGLLTT